MIVKKEIKARERRKRKKKRVSNLLKTKKMKRLLSKSLLVLMVSALIATSFSNAYAQRGNRPMRDSARFERGIPNLTAEQKTKIYTKEYCEPNYGACRFHYGVVA